MLSDWYTSGCKPEPRARWVGDQIEIEGEGKPTKALPDAVLQWGSLVSDVGQELGVPSQLVAGILATESSGKQTAKSFCCYGLMGLLPQTASNMAGRTVDPNELVSNPRLNIELGTKYLKYQLNRYEGNFVKATAAYNAGTALCTGNCLNRWGLRADCVEGIAVDYTTRVIQFTNAAAESGRFTISEAVRAQSSTWGILGMVLFAGGLGFVWWKHNQGRR